MKILELLQQLKLSHYVNEEDCWYSCPESDKCCNDHDKGCTCGATEHNKIVNQIINLYLDERN
jgi:hypothetical protein